MALHPARGHGWAEEVRRQFWSPVYGQKAAATVAVFSVTAELPREFCTLLVTLEEALRVPGKFERIEDQKSDSAIHGYQFSGTSEKLQFFFSESGKNWNYGGLSSDAEFVCRSNGQRGTQRLMLIHGSHVEGAGIELRFKRAVDWGELTIVENRREVSSSEPDAIDEEAALSLQAGPDAGSPS